MGYVGRRSIIPCCSKRLRRLLNTSRAFGSEIPLCAAYSLTRIGNTTGESAFLNLSINHRSTGESLLFLLFALFFVRISPPDDSGGSRGTGLPPEDYTYLLFSDRGFNKCLDCTQSAVANFVKIRRILPDW